MKTGAAVAKDARKWPIKTVIFSLLLPAILIASSGRFDWIGGWAYIAVVTVGSNGTSVLLSRKSPDLLVERSRIQPGTKPWDKLLALLIALVFPFAMWIVGGLDTRYGWSSFAVAWQAAGFVAIVLGILLTLWAMLTNRFFAATVRIQKDRGHTVVSSGPYAYVRHPGYVGMLAYMLGTPLALDSTYALIPAGLCLATLILRTALEDRTLQAELDGYADYARRVRSRLIPGAW